jgi:integrase
MLSISAPNLHIMEAVMARLRLKEYTIFPRRNDNSTTWYYYTYDHKGRRLPAKSTGICFTRERDRVKSKKQAESYLDTLFEKHVIVPGAPTLRGWYDSQQFWDWERSVYVRRILRRSSKVKPKITESFCISAGQITKDYILPYHGSMRIPDITPYDCEQLLWTWVELGRSNKTVSNYKSIYSTLLGAYEREVKMKDPESRYFNPWRMVEPLSSDRNRYGGLTLAEVQNLLTVSGDLSESDRVYFDAVKTAFLSGLRIGEVCGLFTDDVQDVNLKNAAGEDVRYSFFRVSRQWCQRVNKRTLVKDKDVREIPILPSLRDDLDPYLTGQGRYVFSFHPRKETPITPNRLRDWYYKRLESAAGIDKDTRESRRIVFHSSRRFFNTFLRNEGIPTHTIQKLTGHDSEEMTEHYTDYLPEDMQNITAAQEKMLQKRT